MFTFEKTTNVLGAYHEILGYTFADASTVNPTAGIKLIGDTTGI